MNGLIQPSMFDGAEIAEPPEARALARREDPATSKGAAEGVANFAKDHYAAISEAMVGMARPVGPEQISSWLLRKGVKLDAYQIRKRLPEMQKALAVRVHVIDGKEATRPTSSGRHERLWELVGDIL